MTDYSELKRLAEACKGWDNMTSCWPDQEQDGDADISWIVGHVGEDGDKYPVLELNTVQYDAPDDAEKLARFYAGANPAAVLALIAENDLLRGGLHDIAKKASESRSLTRRLTWIEGRAESALLGKPWAAHVFMMPDPKNGKPKAERLEAENKQLKAENEALRAALEVAALAMWNSEANMDSEAAAIEEALASAAMSQEERA